MNMKKIFAVLCLCVLLPAFAAFSAFAADPFRVHRGALGPKIKSYQLGMSITLLDLLDVVSDMYDSDLYHMLVETDEGNLVFEFSLEK